MSTLNVKDSSGNWKEIPSIGGYTMDEINAMLANKANRSHNHSISEITSLQSKLNIKYTILLDDTARGNGTYTLSQAVDNFDMLEVKASCWNGTEMYFFSYIPKGQYDLSSSTDGYQFLIPFDYGNTNRRIVFHLKSTTIKVGVSDHSKLMRIRGINFFAS